MGKKPVLGWVGVLLAGAGLGGALCTLAGCNNSKSCQSCQAHGPLPASQTVYNPQTAPNGTLPQSQAWNMQRNQVPGQSMTNPGMTTTSAAQPWANSQQMPAGSGNAFNRTPSTLPGSSPMGVTTQPAGSVAAMPGSMGSPSNIQRVGNPALDSMPPATGLGQPVGQSSMSARVPTSLSPAAPTSVPNVPVVEQSSSTWANSAGQPTSVSHDTSYHDVSSSVPAPTGNSPSMP
jgi:hypothetical protein